MDDYVFNDEHVTAAIKINQETATGSEEITPQLVKQLKNEMTVTLVGKVWRRFMYESFRKESEIENSFSILYNPSAYITYIPQRPIDPVNEVEPPFLKRYTIGNVRAL